jgi:transcriptional regulator with XRE-family HTH domain
MTAAKRPDDFTRVDAIVGARVRLLRERRKMSQTALGDRIGVSFQQVQKYERGANRISASALYQIARALEVKPADFFEGIQAEQKGELEWSRTIDPQVNELVKGFGRISSSKIRVKILELVTLLAQQESGNEPVTGDAPVTRRAMARA